MSRQEGARSFRNKSHSSLKSLRANHERKNALPFLTFRKLARVIVQFVLRTAEHFEYSGIRKIWKSVLITCLLLQVPAWGVSPPDVFCKFPILSCFSQNKYKHPGVKSFLLLAAGWQHVFPPWNFWLSPKSLSSCAPFSDGFFPIKLEFAKTILWVKRRFFLLLRFFYNHPKQIYANFKVPFIERIWKAKAMEFEYNTFGKLSISKQRRLTEISSWYLILLSFLSSSHSIFAPKVGIPPPPQEKRGKMRNNGSEKWNTFVLTILRRSVCWIGRQTFQSVEGWMDWQK